MRMRSFIWLSALVALVAVAIAVWRTCPITNEMVGTQGYFKWTQGHRETTYPIHQAFTRDYRLRNSLKGESIEWILERYPEASNGSEYAANSYRGSYKPDSASDGQLIDEVYWLDGINPIEYGIENAENNFGFCVLVREGKIVEFRWIKG